MKIYVLLLLCLLSPNVFAVASDSTHNGNNDAEDLLDNITPKPMVGQTTGNFIGGGAWRGYEKHEGKTISVGGASARVTGGVPYIYLNGAGWRQSESIKIYKGAGARVTIFGLSYCDANGRAVSVPWY